MKALKVLIEKLKRALSDKVVLVALSLLLLFGVIDLFFSIHFQGLLLFYLVVFVGVILKYEFRLDEINKIKKE